MQFPKHGGPRHVVQSADAVDAEVTDSVPLAVQNPVVQCSQVPADGSCAVTTPGRDFEILISLPVGESTIISLQGTVDPGFEDSVLENTAVVATGPDQTDRDLRDNQGVDEW